MKEIINLIMAVDYDHHDNDGDSDSDVVDRDPIAAISVPGVPTAVLVPVTGEVLCPVVPDHHHCQYHSVEDDGGGDEVNLNCG